MDEAIIRLSKIEEAIDAARLGWILCFIAEDQSAKLGDLINSLRGGESGRGKKIDSGYSYWGIGPTCAWMKACADRFYVVMHRSTAGFWRAGRGLRPP